MLSRAFTKPRKSPKDGDGNSRSQSIDESDCIMGFMEDLPLIFCCDGGCGACGSHPTLWELLRSSVGVIGESRLGMTEKVVLLERKVYAVKRFRKLTIRRREFGRRVDRLAQVSKRCDYLVPVTAYLYAKRIKFVLCDYYPMGSLADLLAGEREKSHTALDWKQRLIIILHIARAIDFIHAQSPPHEKNMQMNVHGNIKTSNVMINIDFSACLSDYGFTQLAEPVEVSDTWQLKPPPSPEKTYSDMVCQKSDIHNFGIIMLDLLGGPQAPELTHCILERKEKITDGAIEFFEFFVEGRDRKQALQVLDVALACADSSTEARPPIETILLILLEMV